MNIDNVKTCIVGLRKRCTDLEFALMDAGSGHDEYNAEIVKISQQIFDFALALNQTAAKVQGVETL